MSKEFEDWYNSYVAEHDQVTLGELAEAAFEAGLIFGQKGDLRDQFAMGAHLTLLSIPKGADFDPREYAKWAYIHADAMLKEREK